MAAQTTQKFCEALAIYGALLHFLKSAGGSVILKHSDLGVTGEIRVTPSDGGVQFEIVERSAGN